jgi:hypothetical protein
MNKTGTGFVLFSFYTAISVIALLLTTCLVLPWSRFLFSLLVVEAFLAGLLYYRIWSAKYK